MDNNFLKKLTGAVIKYKYAILILLAGVVLMIMPSGNKKTTSSGKEVQKQTATISVEEQLSRILSNVKGAGAVQVMLTTKAGEQTIYQTDINSSSSDGNASQNSDTVILTDANRVQTGLVCQVQSPIYQGAIILCQGAKDANVRLEIVDAVSKVTGLGSDKISVLEMK